MTIRNLEPGSQPWLDYRRERVTSTDVPAILGQSKWGTPLSVWARITGKTPPEENAPNAFMQWGNLTEDAHRALVAMRLGRPVDKPSGVYEDGEFGWLSASTDGIIPDDADDGLWEGKAPSYYTRGEWADGALPLSYQIQVQAEMRCVGTTWGYASALLPPLKADDDPLAILPVERNERFQEWMMERVVRFWEDNVQKDIPPEVSGSDIDTDTLKTLYPRDTGKAVLFDADHAAILELRASLAESEKDIKAQRAEVDNRLRAYIGDASYGVTTGGDVLSYKMVTRNEKPREARTVEYRQLRAVKALPGGVDVVERVEQKVEVAS